MISLKKSLSDLDRLESMQRAASECYRAAVQTAGEHVVETEKSATRLFREELENLASRVKAAATASELNETRIAFEQSLEQYARQGSRYLRTLEQQVTSTRRALSDVVDSLAQTGGDEQERIESGLSRLEEIAGQPGVRRVCPEMSVLVASIEDGVGKLCKKNQLVVAQLRDELHSLQVTLDKAQHTARRDDRAGVTSRIELLGRIRRMLAVRKSFCLVLLSVSNAAYLRSTYPGQQLDDAYDDFSRQLTDFVEPHVVCGQWNQSVYAVLVEKQKPEAMELGVRLADRLAGPYFPREAADGRVINLRLTSGVIEANGRDTEGRLLVRIERLVEALEDTAD